MDSSIILEFRAERQRAPLRLKDGHPGAKPSSSRVSRTACGLPPAKYSREHVAGAESQFPRGASQGFCQRVAPEKRQPGKHTCKQVCRRKGRMSAREVPQIILRET